MSSIQRYGPLIDKYNRTAVMSKMPNGEFVRLEDAQSFYHLSRLIELHKDRIAINTPRNVHEVASTVVCQHERFLIINTGFAGITPPAL